MASITVEGNGPYFAICLLKAKQDACDRHELASAVEDRRMRPWVTEASVHSDAWDARGVRALGWTGQHLHTRNSAASGYDLNWLMGD